MKKEHILSILAASLILSSGLLSGCGSSATSSDVMYQKGESNAAYAEEAVAYDDYDYSDPYSQEMSSGENYDEAINDHGKKLVHTYNISVQTTEYDKIMSSINSKISQYEGYVESSDMNSYDERRHINMTIRIPQKNATAFLDYVGESTNVNSQSESTVDKTLDYVDIDSRMNSYKQELEVMEELAKKAETVTELIEIENNIAQLRGQIDSYQSQLNSIDNKVSYATIYIDINEVKEYTYSDPTFGEKIKEGLAESFGKIGDMVAGYIVAIPVFLVGLVLLLIPAALIIFIIVMVIKTIVKIVNGKNVSNSAKNNKIDNKTEND